MKLLYSVLLFLLSSMSLPVVAQISASGTYSMGRPALGNSVDTLIVFDQASGSTITCRNATKGDFIWKYYKNQDHAGSTFTVQDSVQTDTSTTTSTLQNVQDGGYIITHIAGTDTTRSTLWVTIYNQHQVLKIDTLIADDSGDNGVFSPCDTLFLRTETTQDSFYYYAPPPTLSGPIELYTILHYTSGSYLNQNLLAIPAPHSDGPLSVTAYEVFQFLNGASTVHYGSTTATSANYTAIALDSKIKADFSTSANPPTNETGSLVVSGNNYTVSVPVDLFLSTDSNNPLDSYIWNIYSLRGATRTLITTLDLPTFTYPISQSDSLLITMNVSNGSCESNDSIQVVGYSSLISAPNTFTPNGDGINDVFKVTYRSVKKFQGYIYNRWGRKVFSWTDPSQGWDGTNNGSPCPPGAYFYKIQITGTDNGHNVQQSISGDINLIRPQ